MALETPTWMNLCFVEKILRKSEDDNSIQVTDVFTKPATNKDNYTSDMFRGTAEFTHGPGKLKIADKKSIVVKVAPITESACQDLMDFQISVYLTPAIDLQYSFNTSPAADVIENQRDVLLNEYLSTLASTMKQQNCKTQPPTMEELKASLRRQAAYRMITSFCLLPFMLNKDKAKDFDKIMGKDGNYTNPNYKSKAYRKVIAKKLPLYDEWGLLDL